MTKIKHIVHLEDLAFFSFESGISALATLGLSQFYIKYDGAPALVFGKVDNRFFLSTKSYFNKTPKINFNLEDIKINHGRSEDLVTKLTEVFPLMEDFYHHYDHMQKDNTLFQGDLLFYPSTFDSGKFVPNTIQYTMKNPAHYDLGIAIHTMYDRGMTSSIPMHDDTHESRPNYYMPRRTIMSRWALSVHEGSFEVFETLRVLYDDNDFYSEINEATAQAAIVEINKLVRSGAVIDEETLIPILTSYKYNISFVKYYVALKNYKELLIANLDKISQTGDLDKHINGMPCGHEGYVARTATNTPVKLVNRSVFSALNFERHK